MRFTCKTVPRLCDTPTPWREDLTPQEARLLHYEMTVSTAEKLLAHEPSMKGLPVALNHRPGATTGQVTGGYIFNDALYHQGYIDESTPLGREVANYIREGRMTSVSLTHFPTDNPWSLELSLCTLNGARPGSGIIEFTEDDPDTPFTPDTPDESTQRTREHYLTQRAMVMASEEFQSTTVISVPTYNSTETNTPLVVTMTEPAPQPQPATTPAPAPQPQPEAEKVTPPPPQPDVSKRESELLEEKLQEWDAGRKPADARAEDSYSTYLMRIVAEGGNVMSSKLRERIMRNFMESQDKARQQEEWVNGLANVVEPLVRKHGVRANPPISVEELREAARQRDLPRIEQYQSRLLAVQASEEMAESHHQALERMDREKKLLEMRLQVVAQEKAADAEKADRERNKKLAEDMYERHRTSYSSPPPPPQPSAQPLPPVEDPSTKGFRKIKADDAHPLLRRLLAENPRSLFDGLSEDEVAQLRRVLGNGSSELAIPSTLDYLAKQGGGTYKPFTPTDGSKLKSQYIPGLVAASEEFIFNAYPDTARYLTSTFNNNLDKASIGAMTSGYGRNPLQLSEYLATSRVVEYKDNFTRLGAKKDSNWVRANQGSEGGYRSVNGMRNLSSSYAKGLQLQAAGHPLYPSRHH